MSKLQILQWCATESVVLKRRGEVLSDEGCAWCGGYPKGERCASHGDDGWHYEGCVLLDWLEEMRAL